MEALSFLEKKIFMEFTTFLCVRTYDSLSLSLSQRNPTEKVLKQLLIVSQIVGFYLFDRSGFSEG